MRRAGTVIRWPPQVPPPTQPAPSNAEGGGDVVPEWGHKPVGTICTVTRMLRRKSNLKKYKNKIRYPTRNAVANAAAKAPQRASFNTRMVRNGGRPKTLAFLCANSAIHCNAVMTDS